jgi:hypothetical protein
MRRLENLPKEFEVTHIAETRYLAMPCVSSERRRYIPMAFLEPDIYCTHGMQMIEGATEYHFGILTSYASGMDARGLRMVGNSV